MPRHRVLCQGTGFCTHIETTAHEISNVVYCFEQRLALLTMPKAQRAENAWGVWESFLIGVAVAVCVTLSIVACVYDCHRYNAKKMVEAEEEKDRQLEREIKARRGQRQENDKST